MNLKNIIVIALIGLTTGQWLLANWFEEQTTQRVNNLKESIEKKLKKTPTHYLSFSDNTQPDTKKSFEEIFTKSAKYGARTFWKLLKESVTQKENPQPPTLQEIIDLVNFFLFTALPTDKNELSFDLLAFAIHGSPELITVLDNFLRSYGEQLPKNLKNPTNLFKVSSNLPWYSIYLRFNENQKYRHLWLGQDNFKSFGIAKNNSSLSIIPHNQNQGRPDSHDKVSNIFDITTDDLISAYLLLNPEKKKVSEAAKIMQEVANKIATKKPSLSKSLFTNGESYIQRLQAKNVFPNQVLLPYIQSLLWNYAQTSIEKTSHNLAPIDPSDEQLADSLQQYSLTKITNQDFKEFRESASRGAGYAKKLLIEKKKIKIAGPTKSTKDKEEQEIIEIKEEKTDLVTPIKDYLQHIVDLNNFFYTLAIFSRDNGVGPATVTFHLAGNKAFREFIYGYLTMISNYDFTLGSVNSITGTNPFAYNRKQSHGFEKSFGIEMRWLAKNFNADKTQEAQPYLFPGRWITKDVSPTVFGPQFHLLVGRDPGHEYQVFFKWEEHGLYGSKVIAHGKDLVLSLARKQSLTRNLFGLTPDDAPQYNKERVPKIIAEIISHLEKNSLIPTGMGLEKIAKTGIAELYSTCTSNEKLQPLIRALEEHFDHPDLRWGNEIVIAPERDDSQVWIDYFTTNNTQIKELYKSFSIIKRLIINLATEDVETKDETKSMISIEKTNAEKLKSSIKKFGSAMKKTVNLPEDITSYLEKMNKVLQKIKKMDDEEAKVFVQRYGRIMFDTKFINKYSLDK